MASRAHPAGWVYIVVHQVQCLRYCNVPTKPNIFGANQPPREFVVALALWSRRSLASCLSSLLSGVHAHEGAGGTC